MDQNKLIEITKKKVKQTLKGKDQEIINLSLIYDKLPDNINQLYENLKVLTDLKYPNLDQYLTIKEYVSFILNNIDLENKENYKEIKKILESNLSIEFDKEIENEIKNLSENIYNLIIIKENIEKEINSLLKERYTNLYYIATPKIAYKMIQIAGSIKRLAKMPSSTIQVLGSEKSFFKALKQNKKTPKYGYIYNHPYMLNLETRKKGRFARTLASKISIAIKADINQHIIYEDLDLKLKDKLKKL